MHKHGLNEITATIENKLKERRFEEVNSKKTEKVSIPKKVKKKIKI